MEMDWSLCFYKICLLLLPVLALVLSNGVCSHAQVKVFDVRSVGAAADWKTDDSKAKNRENTSPSSSIIVIISQPGQTQRIVGIGAFLGAWNQACQYKAGVKRRLFVPQGTTMVWPVVFKGPCNGPIEFKVKGVVKAPVDKSTFSLDHWITFNSSTSMEQQYVRWPGASLRFNFVNNTVICSISSVNSKNFHFNHFKCDDFEFHRVWIIAPDKSPHRTNRTGSTWATHPASGSPTL
ncbi:polygalacturonase-like [Rhodamnia argentea]|uniref:Polygalacturonase-like n=1 Tax=Rhodamnia argentea TaxID=178133 RepID=A0A8B8QX23_9MYRT|nr:polygalacturonase-like [Rhodamnia argentea]